MTRLPCSPVGLPAAKRVADRSVLHLIQMRLTVAVRVLAGIRLY